MAAVPTPGDDNITTPTTTIYRNNYNDKHDDTSGEQRTLQFFQHVLQHFNSCRLRGRFVNAKRQVTLSGPHGLMEPIQLHLLRRGVARGSVGDFAELLLQLRLGREASQVNELVVQVSAA